MRAHACPRAHARTRARLSLPNTPWPANRIGHETLDLAILGIAPFASPLLRSVKASHEPDNRKHSEKERYSDPRVALSIANK